jgi:hypothetical protein
MFELYIKYLLEGIAVAVAAYFIPRKKVEITEIIFIALSAAATFAVLDIFAPKVGDGARKGAGFGIGANTVGWPGVGLERFEDKKTHTTDLKKTHTTDLKKTHKKDEASTDSSSVDSSKDSHSTDSSKDSSSSAKKEGFYADEKSSDSTSTSSTKSSVDEPKHEGGIAGFDNNKSYSQF